VSGGGIYFISQNYRIAEVGRDLWGASGLIPLLKQGHPELVALDRVQADLNISKDGDSTTSLGNLCKCLVTLTVKKQYCSITIWPFFFFFILVIYQLTGKQHF